ncbi:MAG: Gfo/Idh/MocA family oxidoreductase [Flavobacteriales bacterium]|nr:Gfo/Idh/MocA family oxidoreductase [Flavobacteriales bacterium]
MNILIVGYGSIAKKHVEALKAIDSNCEFWALRNSTSKSDDEVNNIYSYQDIPNNIDFAIISNPTNKHTETIKRLIPLKFPLFIEKPIAHNLNDIDKVSLLLAQNQIVTYVACVLRFHPCLQYLKRYIEEAPRRINEVNVYCGSFLPDWRKNVDYKTVYRSKNEEGGGVHLDLFHEIDYSVWIFGKPNYTKVLLESKSSLEIDAYDYANYSMKYDDFELNITLNYYRKTPKRKLEVLFENQTWEIDLIKGQIIEDDKAIIFDSDTQIKDLYKVQMEYFVEKIMNQESIDNDLKTSSEILKICLNE